MNTPDRMLETRKVVSAGLRTAVIKYGVIPGFCVGPILSLFKFLPGEKGQDLALLDMLAETAVVTVIFLLFFSGIAALSWWAMARIVAKVDSQGVSS